ncbi:hypothetical protein PanWU01x14_057900 [Parasponia andersonii]|uniref:Transmembrane protein n=1 Tax=Parasponia andersonii TaxID=3476 RepID=A0A2P5DJZ6_PARAD|nr:hypothetical protein PanWU01x14_057900 [Parasponia andersonii]
MASLTKTFLFIFLLLFMDVSSSRVKGFVDEAKPASLPKIEAIVGKKTRKLITLDAILDYDKPIPNPKHDKKPGGGKKR